MRDGRLQYEMPGCVCWGSKNVPIMEDAFSQTPILVPTIPMCLSDFAMGGRGRGGGVQLCHFYHILN